MLVGSWILFALIIVFVLPPWSGLINILTCIVGLTGTVFACLYLLLSKRPGVWVACLGSGVILVGIYLVRWMLFVQEYLSVDPEYGIFRAIWLAISSRFLISWKSATDGHYLRALVELYWTLGMPTLQVLIIIIALAPFVLIKKPGRFGNN